MHTNRMGTLLGVGENPIVNHGMDQMVNNAYTLRSDLIKGLTDPRRDYDKECGYPDRHGILIDDYKYRYERQDIAQRVVDVLPDESWQATPSLIEDEDMDNTTPFEEAWANLAKSLRGEESWFDDEDGNPLWEYLHRIDRLSGIGDFGILLLGLDDGVKLEVPVTGFSDPEPGETSSLGVMSFNAAKRKERKLTFIRCYDRSLITSIEFEWNIHSPRYGKPKFYMVTQVDAGGMPITMTGQNAPSQDEKVHWSRVVHICDNLNASEIFGQPRMQSVFNRLLDLTKLMGGSAEMYWRGAFPGLSLETHPQLGGDVNINESDLKSKIWDYQNGLQRALSLVGMSAKSLAPQVVDPSKQVEVQIDAICIQLGIPKRLFMGSERGELASGQDDSTWNDRLRARRIDYIGPRIIVPFVDRLIQIGVLPEPDGYQISWPDPETIKPTEQSAIAVQTTDAIVKYVGGGGQSLIDPLDFLTRVLSFDKEEAEEILQATSAENEEFEDSIFPPGGAVGEDGISIEEPQIDPVTGEVLPSTAGVDAPPPVDPVTGLPLTPDVPLTPSDSQAPPAEEIKPLNGAQITAAKDLLMEVSQGALPAEVAQELLVGVGFPLETATRMATIAAAHTIPEEVLDAKKPQPFGSAPEDSEEDEEGSAPEDSEEDETGDIPSQLK